MRPLRREFFPTGAVILLAGLIGVSFPFESVGFKARRVSPVCESSAAFVTLSADEEAAALRAARTSWQSGSTAGQRMRFRLPIGELPAEPERPLFVTGADSIAPRPAAPLDYAAPAWSPSQRAPEAGRIAPNPEKASKPAFSRDELLKLN